MKRRKRLLPVKTSLGWDHPIAALENSTLEYEESEEEENDEIEAGEEETVPDPEKAEDPETYVQSIVRSRRTLCSKKAEIANLCCSVVQNPSENYAKLRQLRNFCVEIDSSCAVTVRKLAMISLATVFKDIAPGYYIRELTDEEKAVKVAKDTRALRDFEQSLVNNYQHYVGLLERYVQAVSGSQPSVSASSLKKLKNDREINQAGMEALAVTAAKCMCTLVQNLSHFNCSKQLVQALVPRLDSKQCNGDIAKACAETVREMFTQHGASEVNVEAVTIINKVAKTRRDGRLGVSFVEVLLCFETSQLAEASAAAASARKEQKEKEREAKAKLSRKEKKNLKASKKLDREMLEVQATESRDKRVKLQTELLKLIFSVYFRILKHSPHKSLLPAVLEGLAKFAHLINIDFFGDLFQLLDSIVSMSGLSTRERLHCVLTAFQILSGHGQTLTVDPRQFYCHLYQCLLELCTPEGQSELHLATDCLGLMLRKRRQVSVQRVLSFVKRLATISLHQEAAASSVALLNEVRSFMRLYSCVGGLLDSDVVTSGVFQPEANDPECSHANCTSLWELTLLGQHYDGNVKKSAKELAQGS